MIYCFFFKSLTAVFIFYGWNLFKGYIFFPLDDKVGQIICFIHLNISKINGKCWLDYYVVMWYANDLNIDSIVLFTIYVRNTKLMLK